MTEEEQGVEQLATADGDSNVSTPATEQEPDQNSDKEINFRQMRQSYETLHQENEALKKQNAEFMSKVSQAFSPTTSEEEDLDDLSTKGDVKREIEKLKRQYEIDAVPLRYADYYEVIKFVEPMIKDNPALAAAIENSPNPRDTAYQLVKSSHAYNSGRGANKAQKIQENLSKPVSSEANLSGTGMADYFTPMTLEEKADVHRKSQMYARGVRQA